MSRPSLMGIVFILLTVICNVACQLLVKKGTLEVGGGPTDLGQLPTFAWQALTNWKVLLGLACAGAAALFWIVALSRADLNFAFPFLGLSIALVLVLSGVLLGENVPPIRWIGVGIVCLGIFLASR